MLFTCPNTFLRVTLNLLTHYRLEIGSGGGLVGLAVAIGCDTRGPLYITDQENMISLMKQNISLNKLEDKVVPLVLDW